MLEIELMNSNKLDERRHGNEFDVRQDNVCWVRQDDECLIEPETSYNLKSLGRSNSCLLHCIKLLRGITKS